MLYEATAEYSRGDKTENSQKHENYRMRENSPLSFKEGMLYKATAEYSRGDIIMLRF